jgi:uncharacterized protein
LNVPTSEQLAEEKILGFSRALYNAGLLVDPSRSIEFLAAMNAMSIRSLTQLARIGRIVLTGNRDNHAIYDRVFNEWFLDKSGFVADPDNGLEERIVLEKPKHEQRNILDMLAGDASGKIASVNEMIGRKAFEPIEASEVDQLGRIQKAAQRLPQRLNRKWKASRSGTRIDVARTCTMARRTFGETLRLAWLARSKKHRKMLLLIDISGSMQTASGSNLKMAHAIVRVRPNVEVFCLGTTLTRVTESLTHPHVDVALQSLGQRVFDFDGGTLLGRGLSEFLAVSKHAALVRGALTIVISDGLERGDFAPMVKAVERLTRLSHRLVWWTPLANDPLYVPATRALSACLPFLDVLDCAGSLNSLAQSLAHLSNADCRPRRQAARLFAAQRHAA